MIIYFVTGSLWVDLYCFVSTFVYCLWMCECAWETSHYVCKHAGCGCSCISSFGSSACVCMSESAFCLSLLALGGLTLTTPLGKCSVCVCWLGQSKSVCMCVVCILWRVCKFTRGWEVSDIRASAWHQIACEPWQNHSSKHDLTMKIKSHMIPYYIILIISLYYLLDKLKIFAYPLHFDSSSVSFVILFLILDPFPLRVFGFVAKKPGSLAVNVCHLFAELDPEQPASAIVNFINKVMLSQRR